MKCDCDKVEKRKLNENIRSEYRKGMHDGFKKK